MTERVDPISNALGTLTSIHEQNDIIEISKNKGLIKPDEAKDNIKRLIDGGMDSFEDLVKLAKESESPRAYEVLTNFMKTLVEMNKTVIDLENESKDKPLQSAETINNNQYIFSGSTEDMLKYIKQAEEKL